MMNALSVRQCVTNEPKSFMSLSSLTVSLIDDGPDRPYRCVVSQSARNGQSHVLWASCSGRQYLQVSITLSFVSGCREYYECWGIEKTNPNFKAPEAGEDVSCFQKHAVVVWLLIAGPA